MTSVIVYMRVPMLLLRAPWQPPSAGPIGLWAPSAVSSIGAFTPPICAMANEGIASAFSFVLVTISAASPIDLPCARSFISTSDGC
jgi:hypothetical protein